MTSRPNSLAAASGAPRRRWALSGLSVLAATGLVATAGCSASGTTAASPPSAAAAAPHGKPARRGIAGQISAMNGSSWTVTTARGVAYTVNLTPTTTFGSQAVPATQSQFTTGERVRVIGQPSDKTVTATRIVAAHAATPTQPGAPAAGSASPTGQG